MSQGVPMMQVRWSLAAVQGKRKALTTDYTPPNKRGRGPMEMMQSGSVNMNLAQKVVLGSSTGGGVGRNIAVGPQSHQTHHGTALGQPFENLLCLSVLEAGSQQQLQLQAAQLQAVQLHAAQLHAQVSQQLQAQKTLQKVPSSESAEVGDHSSEIPSPDISATLADSVLASVSLSDCDLDFGFEDMGDCVSVDEVELQSEKMLQSLPSMSSMSHPGGLGDQIKGEIQTGREGEQGEDDVLSQPMAAEALLENAGDDTPAPERCYSGSDATDATVGVVHSLMNEAHIPVEKPPALQVQNDWEGVFDPVDFLGELSDKSIGIAEVDLDGYMDDRRGLEPSESEKLLEHLDIDGPIDGDGDLFSAILNSASLPDTTLGQAAQITTPQLLLQQLKQLHQLAE
ncbi:MAG: hypothetical protein SGPRY_011509, partial [Prymnesium sp.]